MRTLRADDGIRTRDPHLGKVMRYQLRYVRTLTDARPSSEVKHYMTVNARPKAEGSWGPGRLSPWMSPEVHLHLHLPYRWLVSAMSTPMTLWI